MDRRFAQQFYLEQARAFVWGQQPTLANFRPAHLEDRAEELNYVLRLALASLSREPLTPWLEVNAAAYGLPDRGWVYRMDARGRTLVGEATGQVWRLNPTLGPLDACLLELNRAAPPRAAHPRGPAGT